MNPATYLVALEVRTGPGPNDVVSISMGTAFAIGRRLLATNAHITELVSTPFPLPVERVLGIQSGTGRVVELLRAITHPDYNGDPLRSPDVGLLTTKEELTEVLPLATEAEVASLALGDEVALTGFPGDVDQFLPVEPGVTVPQATSLIGTVTAVRSFNPNVPVGPDTTDSIQHQAPTSPGTSGSPLVRCGKVIAANNAGTVEIASRVTADGRIENIRIPAASNNFGIHVKHLHEMVALFEDQALQGRELPPPSGRAAPPTEQFAGTYQGSVAQPPNAVHSFTFTIAADGAITGSSNWPATGSFTLTGSVDAAGALEMSDDAHIRIPGFNQGVYRGTVNAASGQVTGTYIEGNFSANWTANRQ